MTGKRNRNEFRNQQLAAIHVGKKRLHLDDETYRALLERCGGHRSAADMDPHGRRAVLREMARLDRQRLEAAVRAMPGAPQNVKEEVAAMVAKVGAVLVEAGRQWAYAHSMAQKMFKTHRVEWLHADQLHKLVAALVIDRRRRRARESQ